MRLGETVLVSGLAMVVVAPHSGILASRMDLRPMLLIGFAGRATSTCMRIVLTPVWDFRAPLLPQILRDLSPMLCKRPTDDLAPGTLPADKLKGASGLSNLIRTPMGAVGRAVIITVLTDRPRGLEGPTAALAQMSARHVAGFALDASSG